MVAAACHAVWILEQPAGSADVLPFHPRLDWFFNEITYVTRLGMLLVHALRLLEQSSGCSIGVGHVRSGVHYGQMMAALSAKWPGAHGEINLTR